MKNLKMHFSINRKKNNNRQTDTLKSIWQKYIFFYLLLQVGFHKWYTALNIRNFIPSFLGLIFRRWDG